MTCERAMPDTILRPHIPILHLLERSIRIFKRRMARRADCRRASACQRNTRRISPKSIQVASHQQKEAENQDKYDGNAAIANGAYRLIWIYAPIALLVVDIDPCKEDGLRHEPVHDPRAGHERKRVRIRELEEIGAALDAAWRRDTQGLALEGITRPLPVEQLAREHAVVREVENRQDDLGRIDQQDGAHET